LKAGAITLRCAVWIGGSCAMKLGNSASLIDSAIVMLPSFHDEENTSGINSICWICSCVTADQYPPNGLSGRQLIGISLRRKANGSRQVSPV
jgi:hypothetical protein